jgi:nucleoside-diphosphate kinase
MLYHSFGQIKDYIPDLSKSLDKYFLLYSVSMSQKTFLAVKPESFKRNDTVGIVKMLEEKLDAKCLAMKAYTPSKELAEAHYAVHKERPFFGELISSFTSGPILGMVWEGENVIEKARELMGATNPEQAAEGTIRKAFAKSIGDNAIHGSDAPETAENEIKLHFSEAKFSVIASPSTEAENLIKATV